MKIQEREINWYLNYGKYPQLRIARSRSGEQYVIGDWSWNSRHPNQQENIENRMQRAGIVYQPIIDRIEPDGVDLFSLRASK